MRAFISWLSFTCILLSCLYCSGSPHTRSCPATRTTKAPIIDGDLNDSAWLNVPVADSFINAYPDFGKVSPQKTVVKIIYDDQAIYIAAYMYDTDPSKIATQLSARDQVTNSYCDFFAIGFDTYHDRQNAVR